MKRPSSTAVLEFLNVWGLLTLIIVVGFVITFQYVGAPPPKVVRIATGSENGAYYAFARAYAHLLASDGIVLEVVPTAGSVENFALLKEGTVSLALVQGGSATSDDKQRLQSLGSLFPEPVWIFTRARNPIAKFSDLKGRRVAVGSPGSGTQLLATELLTAAGFTESNTTLVRGDSAIATAALTQGTIDAAFFVASPAAPLIRGLLDQAGFQLVEFDRAAAYGRLFPYLTPVILAEGVFNLARNVPPRDTNLMATSANLAARRDLNPSLIPALLNAVTKVHRQGGLLDEKRRFPSVDFVDLPLNEDARRYIVNGPSFLYRWLPYGWAVLLDRLKILIFPILALLIPLFRIAPPLYTWRIRSKIYRWYGAVRDIDLTVQEKGPVLDAGSLQRRLAELEREVASVSVPLSYTGELYNLRLHIGFLQEKLENLKTQAAESASDRNALR